MPWLLPDLRSALRVLLRYPGFCAIVVATLALGVGVSSAVFSVVSGILLNPTPWRDADRAVFVWDHHAERPDSFRPLSYARLLDLEAQSESLAQVGAARGFTFILTDRERYESVPGAFLAPHLFEMLGLRIALGRALGEEDARPGAPPAVVIDHATWRTRFGSDPEIIGRSIEIERRPWTVVGVLEPEIWFPNPGTSILAAFRPTDAETTDRTLRSLLVVARLAPSASLESVESELELISRRLAETYPETDGDWPLVIEEMSEAMFGGPSRIGVVALAGALGFLLLIACANLTGLLLARAAARQKEIAVRSAVGASRGQVVRQLLIENLVLAAVAVPVALAITRATLELIYLQVPPQVLQIEQVFRFDAPVWLFAAGAALCTVFAFGLTPALHASGVEINRALKEGGDRGASAGGAQGLRSALVVGQLALSVVLLVGASLLGQSFFKIVNAETGFEMKNLFYAPLLLPDLRYPEASQRVDFQKRLVEGLATVAGVEVAGVADAPASGPGGPIRRFEIASQRGETATELRETRWIAASPGYLEALGLRLVAGRHLTATDDERGRRVAVVSRGFARANFAAGESALGQRIVLEDGGEVEIVGVVQDVKQIGFNIRQRPQVYVPYAQQPSFFLQIVARTSVAPLSVGPGVRAQIDGIDPLLPVFRLTTALRERALAVWPVGLFAAVLGLVGAVGLAMATIGIYGVVRCSTQERTREFGIRSALGAQPRSLVLLVLRRVWLLAGVGLGLGLLMSSALGTVLQGMLYEVAPFQPASLLLPATLLAISSLLAGILPAARVSRVNPVTVLGAE